MHVVTKTCIRVFWSNLSFLTNLTKLDQTWFGQKKDFTKSVATAGERLTNLALEPGVNDVTIRNSISKTENGLKHSMFFATS